MRRRQVEQTQEEERERSTKERRARVKIFNATSPPPSLPRLLADNYTSRSYKELGRSKLKASKISFPSPTGGGEREVKLAFQNQKMHDFRQDVQQSETVDEGRSGERKRGRRGWSAITERLPAAAARLIEHCNSTRIFILLSLIFFFSFFRDFP